MVLHLFTRVPSYRFVAEAKRKQTADRWILKEKGTVEQRVWVDGWNMQEEDALTVRLSAVSLDF